MEYVSPAQIRQQQKQLGAARRRQQMADLGYKANWSGMGFQIPGDPNLLLKQQAAVSPEWQRYNSELAANFATAQDAFAGGMGPNPMGSTAWQQPVAQPASLPQPTPGGLSWTQQQPNSLNPGGTIRLPDGTAYNMPPGFTGMPGGPMTPSGPAPATAPEVPSAYMSPAQLRVQANQQRLTLRAANTPGFKGTPQVAQPMQVSPVQQPTIRGPVKRMPYGPPQAASRSIGSIRY